MRNLRPIPSKRPPFRRTVRIFVFGHVQVNKPNELNLNEWTHPTIVHPLRGTQGAFLMVTDWNYFDMQSSYQTTREEKIRIKSTATLWRYSVKIVRLKLRNNGRNGHNGEIFSCRLSIVLIFVFAEPSPPLSIQSNNFTLRSHACMHAYSFRLVFRTKERETGPARVDLYFADLTATPTKR